MPTTVLTVIVAVLFGSLITGQTPVNGDIEMLRSGLLATAAVAKADTGTANAINAKSVSGFNSALGQLYDAEYSAWQMMSQVIPCTTDGELYKELVLAQLELIPRADECRLIAVVDPTLQGVNRMLKCLQPVDAALVAMEKAVAAQGSKLGANSGCTSNPNVLPAPALLPPLIIGVESLTFRGLGSGVLGGFIRSAAQVDAETGNRLDMWQQKTDSIPPTRLAIDVNQPMNTTSIWRRIQSLESAYPGTVIPKRFKLLTPTSVFLVTKRATAALVNFIFRSADPITTRQFQTLYQQALLYSLGEAIQTAEQQGITYTPSSVVDSGADASAYYMRVRGWELGFQKGIGGSPDQIFQAILQSAAVPLSAVAQISPGVLLGNGATMDSDPEGERTVSINSRTQAAAPAAIQFAPTGGGAAGIALDSVHGRIYLTNTVGGTVTGLNAAGLTTAFTVGSWPRPEGIAVDSLTGNVYVTDGFERSISILQPSGAVLSRISVDSGAAAIAIDATARRAYVAERFVGAVSVIDMTSNTVLISISVGSFPNAVAVNPSTHRLYVANLAKNAHRSKTVKVPPRCVCPS